MYNLYGSFLFLLEFEIFDKSQQFKTSKIKVFFINVKSYSTIFRHKWWIKGVIESISLQNIRKVLCQLNFSKKRHQLAPSYHSFVRVIYPFYFLVLFILKVIPIIIRFFLHLFLIYFCFISVSCFLFNINFCYKYTNIMNYRLQFIVILVLVLRFFCGERVYCNFVNHEINFFFVFLAFL